MYNDIEKELVFTENPENEIWQTILQFSYEANIKKYLEEHQLPINDDLVNNIKAVISALKEAKPEGVKGKYIKNIYLTSTMGPSFVISIDK